MVTRDCARGGRTLFVAMAIPLVLTRLVPQALSVRATYDAKLGRRFDLGRYLSAGLRPIVPLLVCWLVVMLMSALASALFLLPGLWLLAVFAVVVPASVVEGAGFGGPGRSIGLDMVQTSGEGAGGCTPIERGRTPGC